MDETFTIDELLEVLVSARRSEPEAAPGAFTMIQLKEIMKGRSANYIADLLRPLIESGRVECVRVPFTRIDGVRSTVPAYRLVEGASDGDSG